MLKFKFIIMLIMMEENILKNNIKKNQLFLEI
jgi:hypothetical protein